MARRRRLEYLRKKRAKQRIKEMQRESLYRYAQREEETNQDTEEKQFNFWKELLSWVIYIVIIFGVTHLIVHYVGQRTQVNGESMLPALENNDNLIVDKISYRFRDPERYEIIVFPYKYQEDTYYSKRIIGLPGETVQIKDGEVYINDELLGEHYGIEPIEQGREGIAAQPIVLGEDEYFVLGDNRNHSSDSREPNVGVLKRKDLIGRAWVRIWPFDSMGVIQHE